MASDTVLAGLIEGEDESRYGVALSAGGECVLFEVAPNGSVARWERVDDVDFLEADFQAISVAVSILRLGQIS